MLQADKLSISKGEDEQIVLEEASQLVDEGKWHLCDNGRGLERQFKFKTFKSTWDFMTEVATECKKTKHHPEWSNVYNKTHIRWTTHNPEGLSSKDTSMARFCDAAAKGLNELAIEPEEVKTSGRSETEAGDCCSGKKT